MASEIEYNDHVEINSDNAILLLAAAEELGEPAAVVETTSNGYFRVPQSVVDKAGLGAAHKQSDKTPSDKVAEQVREPRVFGDPMADGDPQPFTHPDPLIPQQDVAEETARAKALSDAPAKKAAAKRAPAKKAAAKKAAATQKSE